MCIFHLCTLQLGASTGQRPGASFSTSSSFTRAKMLGTGPLLYEQKLRMVCWCELGCGIGRNYLCVQGQPLWLQVTIEQISGCRNVYRMPVPYLVGYRRFPTPSLNCEVCSR